LFDISKVLKLKNLGVIKNMNKSMLSRYQVDKVPIIAYSGEVGRPFRMKAATDSG
jgi:hypothetical protein